MCPEDLSDLEKHSQKGLHGYTVDVVNRVFREEERRIIETGEFLGRLCLLDRKCTLWHLLWHSGGVRSFVEIQTLAKRLGVSSPATLSKYLRRYIELELAAKNSLGKYQIIGPRWLEFV